jgi:transposase
MQTGPVFVGVDVAKAELVVARHGQSRALERVRNDATSIEAWLATVPPQARIAMESTGRYHGLLARLASAAGFVVYVLNAADLYFYAKQQGTRAKTDRLDAHRIADYLAEHQRRLHPWQSTDSVQYRVQTTLQRRAKVVKHQEAIRQCLRDAPELAAAGRQLQDEFECFLCQVDRHLEQLVASDERLLQGCRRLRTVPGIGAQTSTLLAALLSRVPFANADALVAFCGLDPRADDSGTKRGRRRLTKRGPALLRRQLWLAAFSGTRTAALKPIYQQLKQRGFASTEAVVILARKLLRIAFAVWRSNEDFKQELLVYRA